MPFGSSYREIKMATISRKILRLVTVAGAVPVVGIAVGYQMRRLQAAENTETDARVFKICEIPLYPSPNPGKPPVIEEPYPRDAVEANIQKVRESIAGFLVHYQKYYYGTKRSIETGITQSRAKLHYLQNNPGELPRVICIAVAGMGGVVLGYRGGSIRKVTYGTIAGLSCAALCYPKKSVELTHEVADYFKASWKENVGEDIVSKLWPFPKKGVAKVPVVLELANKFEGNILKVYEEAFSEEQTNINEFKPPIATEVSQTIIEEKAGGDSTKEPVSPTLQQVMANVNASDEETVRKLRKGQGDLGQSNPLDKDMYSTRSS
ncbi:unnamed protein product [Lymnaea stagnalis]|uniref:MICOS complex subunit n=1 Tax=Lymnaea stagnalis TaxID=6523 RepID=A0AAV2HPR0_LYMST